LIAERVLPTACDIVRIHARRQLQRPALDLPVEHLTREGHAGDADSTAVLPAVLVEVLEAIERRTGMVSENPVVLIDQLEFDTENSDLARGELEAPQ
jgi:hypothetical protein